MIRCYDIHYVPKNDTALACYNFNIRRPVLIRFGRQDDPDLKHRLQASLFRDSVVNRIQVRTVWWPQIWRGEFRCFRLQQLDCLTSAVCRCVVPMDYRMWGLMQPHLHKTSVFDTSDLESQFHCCYLPKIVEIG